MHGTQVGQCGNQLGQSLWQALESQCPLEWSWSGGGRTGGQQVVEADRLEEASSAFFRREHRDGRRQARCLLVDTEPKVVQSVLRQDSNGIFARRRCYLGESGRGNNWAFGYQILKGWSDGSDNSGGGGGRGSHQQQQRRPKQQRQPQEGREGRGGPAAFPSSSSSAPSSAAPAVPWNSSALVEDPGGEEFRILEGVGEGLRLEGEACDFAPDFLLLHSLGGGSGSGLGSRILEHIREEHPLNHIATVSVAPRSAGDSPMQSLNSVMALGFLQAFSDAVLIFDNQEMLDSAERRKAKANARGGGGGDVMGGSATLQDANALIASHVLGALWPMVPSTSYHHSSPVAAPAHLPLSPVDSHDSVLRASCSRIRDIVGTVAADVCCKIVEARTVFGPPSSSSLPGSSSSSPSLGSVWGLKEACQALHRQCLRFDALDGGRPVTTSGALLLARGFGLGGRGEVGDGRGGKGGMSSSTSAVPGNSMGSGARERSDGRGQSQEKAYSHLLSTYVQSAPSSSLSSAVRRGGGGRAGAFVGQQQEDCFDIIAGRWGREGLFAPPSLAPQPLNPSSQPKASRPTQGGHPSPSSSLTSVSCRSNVIGLLGSTLDRASATWQAGAYLHWYERYGCSKEAVRLAIEQVGDVVECYRSAHGIVDWQ